MEGILPFVYRIIVSNPRDDFYSTVPNDSGRFGSPEVTPRALLGDELPVQKRSNLSAAAPVREEAVASGAEPSALASSKVDVRVAVSCSHAQPLQMAPHVKAN